MSALHFVDGRELVGRLDVGERVLQFALPGGVRAERVPRRGHPRRVEPDQFRGDLPHRLAGAALGLGPVGSAEPVQAGHLAADVPGHLVELVGRHVQPVGRLAPLAGRVLDHQVFPDRALDAAAGHLLVPADAVLLVHDVVTGGELERVDAATPAAGHPPPLPRSGMLADQVGLGEHGQPHGLPGEPVRDQRRRHARHSRLRRGRQVTEPRAEALTAEHLGQALRRAMALGDQHHPPALAQPAPDVGQCPAGVAAVGGGGGRAEAHRRAIGTVRITVQILAIRSPVVGLARSAIPGAGDGGQRTRAGVGGVERRNGPPGQPQVVRGGAHLGDRLERGRPEVHRCLAARRRVHPGRLEELLAGADQVGGPRADPLGVAGEHRPAGGHVVEQQFHPRGEHRGERLHALDGDAVGQLAEHVGEPGVIGGEVLGPVPDVGRQQQFAARRRPQAWGRPQAALVGHPEETGLLDRVAEQLDPHRVFLRGREDVDDATADRHLTAPLHQVRPHVADVDEPGQHLVQVAGVTFGHRDRLHVGQAADDRLEQGAHRSDQDGDRGRTGTGRIGVGKPAQHRHALAGGVRAGGEPFVRERLPGGEVGHAVGGQQRAEGPGQFLGFPGGRGDREQEPGGGAGQAGQGRGEQRTERGRRGHVRASRRGKLRRSPPRPDSRPGETGDRP